jgi:ribosomal protein L37AE/L43A
MKAENRIDKHSALYKVNFKNTCPYCGKQINRLYRLYQKLANGTFYSYWDCSHCKKMFEVGREIPKADFIPLTFRQLTEQARKEMLELKKLKEVKNNG